METKIQRLAPLWIFIGVMSILFNMHQCERGDESNKELMDYRRNAMEERRRIRQERDSAIEVSLVFRDSFDIQVAVNASLMGQVREKDETISKINKRYENVLFIRTTRDSERDSIWAELYPALDSIR